MSFDRIAKVVFVWMWKGECEWNSEDRKVHSHVVCMHLNIVERSQ